jgi:pimeloyl-ACP methyl ester carboxylesterase
MKEAVVLIHGIWMTGLEMLPLQRRLRQEGLEAHIFHYHSLIWPPARNARLLNDYLRALDADIVHLVAHSLGGLVLLHLFDRNPEQKPGRVLMLGSPLQGSHVARKLSRYFFTRPLIGRSIERGLLGDAPRWKGQRKLIMIAGDRGFGVGSLVGGLPRPNDGTVSLEETQSTAVNLHLRVPYSHFRMLVARNVLDTIVACLRGEFD